MFAVLAAANALALRTAPAFDLDVATLAERLRSLYAEPGGPGERWGHGSPVVRLPDGKTVSRESAYRDHSLFPVAAARLLASQAGDDAALGAWLLGTLPSARAQEVEPLLIAALRHKDPLAAFEAARGLATVGGRRALPALRAVIRSDRPDAVRRAAGWSAARIEGGGLPAREGFLDGVNWWFQGEEDDAGAASFRHLASLGVRWVSFHSWDPLQKSARRPEFEGIPGRYALPNLPAWVRNAHAAGLKVMVKPHLEMRRRRPDAEEVRILRGNDEAARNALLQRFQTERAAQGWHNVIEMESDADWGLWFRNYEAYLLRYAERAQEAGADMFCVGRELDRTVVLREADWRQLISRVRQVFKGPLVYSANFDSYEAIAFWDALDYIGISAYFSLSADADPAPRDLESGWARVLAPLEARSRRFARPVLFTEIGYASVAGTARTPWSPPRGPAAPWLQARCYEAASRAVASRPWIRGTFWWLWEGVTDPPFRDSDYTVRDKPAAFLMSGLPTNDP